VRQTSLFAIVLLMAAAWGCKRSEPAPPAADTARTQNQTPAAPNASVDLAYVCPMDRDIRSTGPGKCPRCGMELVAGVPDTTPYRLDLTVAPKPTRPNETAHLAFEVFDPWKNNPVEKFSIVHEKLFHAFIVSRDLQFFVHDHPTWADGRFHYDIAFPKPGMYRVLGDFYPEAASPQLITDSIFVAGAEAPAAPLTRDYSAKQAENLNVEVSTSPEEPMAGVTAQMRFLLTPGDGLQKYLGAWGHMLVASDDLIDMIHTHPFIANGSPEMQFSLVFPRPRMYRVWVQFQRNGAVNTAHFDVQVRPEPAVAVAAGT
jgi:Heavy metal binding domain